MPGTLGRPSSSPVTTPTPRRSSPTSSKPGGLRAVDAGSLRRARELEALSVLQITLAASEQIAWSAGFAVVS